MDSNLSSQQSRDPRLMQTAIEGAPGFNIRHQQLLQLQARRNL